MRTYTNFEITEGMDAVVQTTFTTMEDALEYIEERYGADNVVDQLVQINASNEDGEIETFGYLEIYDMLKSE